MKSFFRICLIVCFASMMAACGGNTEKPPVIENTDSLPPDLAAVNQKIRANPDNDDLYRERAELLLGMKKPEEALSDINKALSLDKNDPANYRVLSDIYFSMGRAVNCREALMKALELNPEDPETYLKVAELEFYFKDYKKAIDNANKALDIDNLSAKAHFIKGMCYKENGDTLRALKSFRTATDIDQEYFHAFMQLGIILSAMHNPMAVDYFNNAIQLNPNSIEAHYALAMFCQEHEEYNKAIEAYTNILTIDPKYKYAHYNLGYIHLVYLKVYDMAAKHFTDAINADPDYAEAWYNRGYCYELLGDVQRARSDYQRALQIRVNYQKAVEGMNRLDKLMRK